MFFMHPACLIISWFLPDVQLPAREKARFSLLYMLPMMLLAAI